MALKALMLRKRITESQNQLDKLRAKDKDFEQREAELEASIAEAETDEERAAVDEAINGFETEKEGHEAEKKRLEEEVTNLENELTDLEEETALPKTEEKPVERKEYKPMEIRDTRFKAMNFEQRSSVVEREDVKEFLTRARDLGSQQRGVNGADLLIPEYILGLIRHEVAHSSKLLGFTNVVNVSGKARQNIAGAIPEGVWTEMCANINELNITFNQVEVDGYKVGGYIAICNATLADSDINLADEIITAIGGAIGKALDKAILFGTGTKMPLGIATRLAQTSQPANWGTNAPAWTDLHTSNVLKINQGSATGATFFAALIEKLAVAKDYYHKGGLFWVMNRKTHLDIMAKALEVNANAAIVSNTTLFPIVGGTIVEFEDNEIADYEIIGGFGGNYLTAQREGINFAQSDVVFFLADQTVFKGTARYDGMPVAGEAFVIVNYNNTNPTTSKTFAVDYANTAMNILTVTAANGGTTGTTVLTVSDSVAQSGQVYKYIAKKTLAELNIKVGDKLGTAWTSLTSGTTAITAAAGVHICVAELDGNSRVVSVGEVISNPKA